MVSQLTGLLAAKNILDWLLRIRLKHHIKRLLYKNYFVLMKRVGIVGRYSRGALEPGVCQESEEIHTSPSFR